MFPVQSVDTMKYSRDLARQKLRDSSFDLVINGQIKDIANLGATHVAIATPYDSEFLPFLRRWVLAARKNNLKVWFRGNFSGWEGWFGYGRISQSTHLYLIENFILRNPDLFEDGDVFSACPECENGGPGDPRSKGNLQDYRKFLINEYQTSQTAFEKIGKKVTVNFLPMNKDVAALIMDKNTTAALGGVVTIDHYIKDPQKLGQDIDELSSQSGGSIAIGEFGGPIPDINGQLTDLEQAEFIDQELVQLSQRRNLISAVNYWVLSGGSTALINDNGSLRPAYQILKDYYTPKKINGTVYNDAGDKIENAKVSLSLEGDFEKTDGEGDFSILIPANHNVKLFASADNYVSSSIEISEEKTLEQLTITLRPTNSSIFYSIKKYYRKLIGKI